MIGSNYVLHTVLRYVAMRYLVCFFFCLFLFIRIIFFSIFYRNFTEHLKLFKTPRITIRRSKIINYLFNLTVSKPSSTLFFGNLSLDLDDKMLKKQIEMFTGEISCFFSI